MAPGRLMLPVDLPVGLRDRVDVEQAMSALFRATLREPTIQPIAINAPVDYHARDVQAQRSELTGHGLRDSAQAGRGGCERRECPTPTCSSRISTNASGPDWR